MEIQILGAHNCESATSRMNCILIDEKLVLDAGGLTSSLSLEAQAKLKAVFLTHAHYDHVRDIPALGMNLYLNSSTTNIYATQAVYDSLHKYLLNDDLYPDWFQRNVLHFIRMEPARTQQIEGYSVTAFPVVHPVPPVGYYIVDGSGKSLFYTGDTGTGLNDVWKLIQPQLLIIEVTASNRWEESVGNGAKHLTPRLLQQELKSFRSLKGYLPQVLLVHLHPQLEEEIRSEIEPVARSLDCSITLAYEGMKILL